jgi:hypothetical protein
MVIIVVMIVILLVIGILVIIKAIPSIAFNNQN